MDPPDRRRRKAVTLKDVARHVGLSPATVSVVLNRAPLADSIPAKTQELIFAAARELRYRPNHLARSLRRQRSHTLGVLLPELTEPYAAGVMSGVDSLLLQEEYFSLVASHQGKAFLIQEYLDLLRSRAVEGLLLLATSIERPPGLPTVVVSGHTDLEGVTNVVIDHDRAAHLALDHLSELGHERIALFKGQDGNADTEDRWRGITSAAEELGLELDESLIFQLAEDPSGRLSRTEEAYREGYEFGRTLLERRESFTALFAFNDVSAIGATRAFLDAGLRVPRDISVVGFDDIMSAAFHNPGLTTVRQPLREMGETAARTLLRLMNDGGDGGGSITVQPDLVVRESTGPVPTHDPLSHAVVREGTFGKRRRS